MFDYIIIGAGSAGCVLANRLSADPSVHVLLIEAGPEDTAPEIHMPAAWSQLQGSSVDWNFSCEPCSGLQGRCLPWPRGRVVGGSSAINAMIYIRGAREDYDLWQELGNTGWSWNDVFPYFLRAENREGSGASGFHATDGPLNVTDLRYVSPLSKAFVQGSVRIGLPLNDDFNGPSQIGAGLFQVTQKNGKRCSAAEAYLHPVRHRPNLTIQVDARVTRIVTHQGRATAVEYISDEQLNTANASAEIILAAGAIGSPHILMLSGIGAAEHLESFGIAPVADLPGVGRNLQDHPVAPVVFRCTEPVSLHGAATQENVEAFMREGRGPLTSNGVEAGAFLKTRPDLRVPDVQIHFAPIGLYPERTGGTERLRAADFHAFTLAVTLLHGESRGLILLRSADPADAPAIQSGYLSDAADVQTLVRGIEIAREIVGSGPFDAFGAEELNPGSTVQASTELETFVRQSLWTCFHPVGTCKMGMDDASVVDPALRVRGIEGLRVVDASIMPVITSGNTNAPTIMIAERAAAMITGNERSISIASA
jgi:choline dehydrogenase